MLFSGKSFGADKWYHGTYAFFNFAYVDVFIPGKLGLSFGKKANERHEWELEFLRGSISSPSLLEDIGEVVDQRLTLIGRFRPFSGSFNLGYGLAYIHFTAFLGNSLLETISEDAPSSDVIDARALGSYFSVGNRWQLGEGLSIGVDWISWSQPLVRLKQESDFLDYVDDEDDKETVKDALDLFYHFPRITLLKFQLGWVF